MGYETKLYIVNKSSISHEVNGKEMRYASKVAEFDISKCYPVSDKFRHYPATNCYVFADDGNTEIIEDCYGEPLKEIPVDKAIEVISKVIDEDGAVYPYRRLAPCLALLKSFDLSRWEDLVVLHYGH